MYKPINFVKPRDEDAELCDIKPELAPPPISRLSGEEAQSFYQDLLGIESDSYPSPAISTKSANVSPENEESDGDQPEEKEPVRRCVFMKKGKAMPKDLLSAAQNGQYRELREILFTRTLDPDVQDAFGWTALHCAAHEGHLSCVKLLLKFGATRDLRDNKGRSAADLARRRKKIRVYHTIKEFGMDNTEADRCGKLQDKVAVEPEITKCTLCGVEFDVEEQKTHESSIVHRAAEQAATDPSYGIPEGNVGFRMLEQMGWEREQGLGVEGQGRKFPVKTQLKRDREGLGLTAKPSRVTHFNPKDLSAVKTEKPAQPKLSRLSSKKSTERNLERDFRRAFY